MVLPQGSRWREKQGGAVRIRNADYTALKHNGKPTLQYVTVSNCCRGIRIHDTTAIYIKDCEVKDISDNGIYFAASQYSSDYGCHNCVVDSCTVKDVGQTGLMNIGGSCNTFKNCQVQNTNGAGGAIFNTKSNITYDNCIFTAVNNDKTKTQRMETLMIIQVPHLVCQ